MKFKNIAKKTPSKKKPALPKKTEKKEVEKESLRKEEIREVVEETVEALLKDDPAGEEGQKTVQTVDDKNTSSEEAEQTEKVAQPDLPANIVVREPEVSQVVSPAPQVGQPVATADVAVSAPVVSASPSIEQPSGEAVQADAASAKKTKKFPLSIFLLIILLGGIAGGGFWFTTARSLPSSLLSLRNKIFMTAQKPTPTPAPLPTPTPTPAQVDLSKYSISVLNGSGIAGAAAKAKSALTSDGFTVTTTGNASTSDYTQTVIAAKANVDSAYLTKLTQSLQLLYSVSSSVEKLDSPTSADVVVTIGSQLK